MKNKAHNLTAYSFSKGETLSHLHMTSPHKKLIEVALPLDAINASAQTRCRNGE